VSLVEGLLETFIFAFQEYVSNQWKTEYTYSHHYTKE
jgi:hypothetical protein